MAGFLHQRRTRSSFKRQAESQGSLWSVHHATRRRRKSSRQEPIVTRTRVFRLLSVLDDALNAQQSSKQSRQDFRTYPPCFPSREDFNGWRLLALFTKPHSDICTDCTETFHKQMHSERRCRHPEVVFREAMDGSIEGFLPQKGKKNDSV
jgi:hypothetical protein